MATRGAPGYNTTKDHRKLLEQITYGNFFLSEKLESKTSPTHVRTIRNLTVKFLCEYDIMFANTSPPVLNGTIKQLCEAGPWGWRRAGGEQLQKWCRHRKRRISTCVSVMETGRDLEKAIVAMMPSGVGGETSRICSLLQDMKTPEHAGIHQLWQIVLFDINGQVVVVVMWWLAAITASRLWNWIQLRPGAPSSFLPYSKDIQLAHRLRLPALKEP